MSAVLKPVVTEPAARVRLVTPTLTDLLLVCHKLRQDERHQWEALGNGEPYDPERAAAELFSLNGPKWTMLASDGQPIIVCGYQMIRPGVWQDWMVGTDEAWANHWRSVTRHSLRIMGAMFDSGARRLQTVALASRVDAIRWYRVLGLTMDGRLPSYGANGEDAVMFSRAKRAATPEGSNDGR